MKCLRTRTKRPCSAAIDHDCRCLLFFVFIPPATRKIQMKKSAWHLLAPPLPGPTAVGPRFSFVFFPTPRVRGARTNSFLPSFCYYNHSLSCLRRTAIQVIALPPFRPPMGEGNIKRVNAALYFERIVFFFFVGSPLLIAPLSTSPP